MSPLQSQKGAALVVAMLMLAVLALLGVTSVNNSTMNLRVTQNLQARQDVEAAAQNAIEQVISSIASFNTPTALTVNGDGTAIPVGTNVVVDAPVCTEARPSEGYSATFTLAPEDTHWDVVANATDTVTAARTTLRQGVVIVMPAGSCP